MPVSPATSLIAPDNRLLGWGIGDLSLYGAQPLPGMVVGPAGKDAVVVATPAAGSGAAPPADAAGDPGAPAHEPALPASGSAATGPTSPIAFHDARATVPDADHAALPAQGLGTTVQPPIASPLQTVTQDVDVASGQSANAAGGEIASASASVLDTVAPMTHATPDTVAATAAGLVTVAAEPLGPIAGTPIVQTAAHATDVVTTPIADAAQHVGDTVLTTATGLVDALAGGSPAPAALAAATATVHDAPDLHGLGGSDPAAGVATLVSMVSSAGMFDLGHAAAPEPAAASTSIAEVLAADETPSVLLGDHHDDALGGHALDAHGPHVGL